jgi:peptide/nickel transport system substrate-binding protein
MLRRFYDHAVYNVLYLSPDLQAYRTDRFTGWIKQPAKVGPVLFSNTSPTYARLKPIAATSADEGGLGTGAIAGIVIGALLLGALVTWFFARRRTADERE